MPDDVHQSANTVQSASEAGCTCCAFCGEPVPTREAKLFGAELLCKDCTQIAAVARQARRPASRIAERAAKINSAAMATNRIAFTAVISIIALGGIAIGAVLVNHATKDTWERDNAASVLALSAEAKRLDASQDLQAALATYDELLALVGAAQAEDEHLRAEVEAARQRQQALRAMIAAEEATRQEEEQARAESERLARQRHEREERERRQQDEKLRQAVARAYSSYAAKTAPLLEELERLHAALTVKILYGDYLSRVQDAKYAYDKWIEDLTGPEAMAGVESALLLEEAMNCYIVAADSWSKLLSSRGGGTSYEAEMQGKWAEAAKKITEAKQLIATGR